MAHLTCVDHSRRSQIIGDALLHRGRSGREETNVCTKINENSRVAFAGKLLFVDVFLRKRLAAQNL